MRVRAAGIITALLLVQPGSTWAASSVLTIDASVSDSAVLVGDILTVQLTAVARADGQVEIIAPGIDGFTELNRSRSEGTSISWTNAGQSITREVTIAIEYQAEKPGQIVIPPFTARLGSHEAKSRPATVKVEGSAQQTVSVAVAGQVAPPEGAERQLFVRYRLDRTKAYLGQQVLMDMEIFAQPGAGFSVEEIGPPPELDGFWKEMLDQPKRLTRRTETVAGQRYDVYRVWRVGLFPLTAGKKRLATAAVTFSSGRSLFAAGQRIRRQTAPIELEILPLPTEGRPADFSNNNVGDYTLTAKVDPTTVPAGKAVVLHVELAGRGNVKNARLPEIGAMEGFRVFPPTVSEQIKTSVSGIEGKKVGELLLMPLVGGRLEIPALALTIFDPVAGDYRRLTTESIRIAVEGDPTTDPPRTIEPERPLAPDGVQQSDRIARSSLKPLRFRSSLRSSEAPIWKQPLFAGMLAGPPLLFAAALLAEALIARAKRDTPSSLKKAAWRRARQRLSAAREAVDRSESAKAYGELREAILELGSTKCGIALRGLTVEQIDLALAERGAPESLRRDVIAGLEAADHARFGMGVGAVDLEHWTAVMEQLDTWTPKEVTE